MTYYSLINPRLAIILKPTTVTQFSTKLKFLTTAPAHPTLHVGSTHIMKISRIIVLMLENRSFDYLLGYSKLPLDGITDG